MDYVRNLLRAIGDQVRGREPEEIGQTTVVVPTRRRVLNEAAHKQPAYPALAQRRR